MQRDGSWLIGIGPTFVTRVAAGDMRGVVTDLKKALQDLDQYAQLDRFDRLNPQRPGNASRFILETLNPSAILFTKYPCTQNCPAAAANVQNYLRTGELKTIRCSPMTEPKAYAIYPDPNTDWGPSRPWTATWTAIKSTTATHGKFVIVEADRGANGPPDLTRWHYFVVLNIRGKHFVVDGFTGEEVTENIDAYVTRLTAKTHKFTSAQMRAVPVP